MEEGGWKTEDGRGPSKNLARFIHCKIAPVIFERSERPARHATLLPTKNGLTCGAGSSLRSRMTGVYLHVDERIGFSKVSRWKNED